LSLGTAVATAKPVKRRREVTKAKVIRPKVVITPAEAWAMVNKLKISVEYQEKSGRWVATFRNGAEDIYLPVPGRTAFAAVQELLAQIGVEVAHG
jgi:hypothetical protein